MAITMNYEHTNSEEGKIGNLAKVVLGGVTYYLNDADLRAIVAAFGTATGADIETADNITKGTQSTKLPNSKQVANYVDTAISGLSGAMHFIGISSTNPATSVTVDGHSSFESGDVVLYGDKEFVYDGTNWRELGDEGIYALKETRFAGLALDQNRTVADVQAALELAAFAYVAEGTASYTPGGSISVALKDADTATDANIAAKANFTPKGSVEFAATTSTGAVEYTPAGDVSQTVTTKAFHPGTMTAISGTPSTQFATNGMVASVSGDTLTFGDITTAVALTAGDITVGTAPSIDATSDANSTDIVTNVTTPQWSGTPTYVKFTGTEERNLIPSQITYVKQVVDTDATKTKFDGTPATITVTPKTAASNPET